MTHRHSVIRRRRSSVLGASALVVFAVAGVMGSVGTPAAVTPEQRSGGIEVPVEATSLVCPAPLADGKFLTTALSAAIAPLAALPPRQPSSVVPPDSAALGSLTQTAFTPIITLSAPGDSRLLPVRTTLGPVLINGTGALAPGLAGDQLTRGTDGPARGLATTPCATATSDTWFMGGGSGVGRTTRLFLSNTDDQPAQVDVVVSGPAGAADAAAGSGVLVPARSRSVLPLRKIAPDLPFAAVHVIVRVGRVSAALLDNQVAGLAPRGIEYAPPTRAARSVVLPGVLAGPEARDLYLLAPKDDTLATVRALTPTGTITPPGLESIQLTAGRVQRIPITAALQGRAASLVVSADSPLVAGVRMDFGTAFADMAYVAGAPVLDGPAVSTGFDANRSHVISFAAPGAAAQVTVTTYGPKSSVPVAQGVVTVPAGSSQSLAVRAPAGSDWVWVVVEPMAGGGPVYAARATIEAGPRGRLAATSTLSPLRVSTTVPTAVQRIGDIGHR